MTLAAKAQRCEDEVFSLHLQDGLVIGHKVDPAGEVLYTNENCGLWTGRLLSALSLKWSVTGDARARAAAHRIARSLERLEQVTGVPGMTARQYKKMQGPGPDERPSRRSDRWYQGPQYRWLSDVSTDEMTWFLTGLADYIGLCAEGEYRRRACALMRRVLGRILDYGMRIVEPDGTVTMWGDCSRATPKEPLYCLHGLGYLKRGELFAGEPRFADAYDEYVLDEEYFRQAVNCYRLGTDLNYWSRADWMLSAPEFEVLIKHDRRPQRRALLTEGLLEAATAPQADVYGPLCSAVLGLGGKDRVRDWLERWTLADDTDGTEKGSYHWVYWKARSAGIIGAED